MAELKPSEPIDESEMYYVSPRNTICEVLRQIYWETRNPDIKLKARIAVTMAKKMQRKLKEYNQDWDKDFWGKNVDSKLIRYFRNSKRHQ